MHFVLKFCHNGSDYEPKNMYILDVVIKIKKKNPKKLHHILAFKLSFAHQILDMILYVAGGTSVARSDTYLQNHR